MIPVTALLLVASVTAFVTWVALSLYVLAVQRRRVSTRRIVDVALQILDRPDVSKLPLSAKVGRLNEVLSAASRELIMHAAADRETPDAAFQPLLGYLTERWGVGKLLTDAAEHRTDRDQWRRLTALRVLFRANHPDSMRLLGIAVTDPSTDVASVALSLLGTSVEPRAIDILFDALRSGRQPASQVAVHIERSPQPTADRLKTFLTDPDPVMRLWGATLLARYPAEPIERDLATLTDDADPRVRKAAIQTLGKIGDDLAADCAIKLLGDEFPYVRAHAARALGELGRADLADDVAALLGDTDWWVRLAAKESLGAMGSDVWPVLMRSLNHPDRFVRNGAAETFQNLGVLDSLIVMEAATDNPGQAKIEMLRRIAAAGGVRFTDSLVERAGPIVGPRIRNLLATIGLEHVGAA